MHDSTTMAMAKVHEKYPPPRENVLLLSCMDLRLIDELAAFMDRDNLTNRYDHLVFAGASLGVLQSEYGHWKETFKDHVRIAIALHKPRDVYIVEHRNCGAYRRFLTDFDDNDPDLEKKEHTKWAAKLALLLKDWWKEFDIRGDDGKPASIQVHGFLMDLRGNLEWLDLESSLGQAATAKKPRKKKS